MRTNWFKQFRFPEVVLIIDFFRNSGERYYVDVNTSVCQPLHSHRGIIV